MEAKKAAFTKYHDAANAARESEAAQANAERTAAAAEAASREAENARRTAGDVAKKSGVKAAGGEAADPDASPLSKENVAEAVDHISRMRSRERLQEVASNDTRAQVKAAAQKRLAEL